MSLIREIKNSINESGQKVFWYDTKTNLLVSGLTKKDTKVQINNMKLKEGTKLIRANIEFHSGRKACDPAKICVVIKTFIIEDEVAKFDNTWQEKANGYIWFDDDFLGRRGWKDYYVPDIVEKINKKYLKLRFGITYYHSII